MNSTVGQNTPGVNASPCLCRGQVWSAQALLIALKIGERTLARWEQAGLQRLQPATDEVYYLSDDVIEIMRLPSEKIPKYLPKYKQKLKGK